MLVARTATAGWVTFQLPASTSAATASSRPASASTPRRRPASWRSVSAGSVSSPTSPRLCQRSLQCGPTANCTSPRRTRAKCSRLTFSPIAMRPSWVSTSPSIARSSTWSPTTVSTQW